MAGPSLPMDDRDGVIWYNGKLVPWREANVHALVHSLHYGNARVRRRALQREGVQAH